MVYHDISSFENSGKQNFATPMSRILSTLLDYFILTPVVSFLVLTLLHDGMSLFKRFPNSDESQIILTLAAVAFVFLFSFIQAAFIFFCQSTPGQIFTKNYVHFENQEFSLFLQAWVRQLGFFASIAMFGLPFLALFYHPKRKPFYDRLTESNVYSRVQEKESKGFFAHSIHPTDRRYMAVSIGVLTFFFIAIFSVAFWNSYESILTSPIAQKKEKKNFCKELDSFRQDKLKVAIALNLVGVIDDHCLDLESDFVLWKNFSEDDRSMAYFAKYMTAEDEESESKYLDKACTEKLNGEGCEFATAFKTAQFEEFYANLNTDDDFLRTMLKYEFSLYLYKPADETARLFEVLENFSTAKVVKKFILNERLDTLAHDLELESVDRNERKPASEEETEFFKRLEKIKKEIRKL